MGLSAGDPFPSKVLKECCSAQAQQAGKRSLLFFYEGDEACAEELAALDELGGELYLRGCELHAVRGGGGATAATPSRYPFVIFLEDARDRLRGALGPAAADQARESYLVDATGTVVSCCVSSTGHAAAAMEPASTGFETSPALGDHSTPAPRRPARAFLVAQRRLLDPEQSPGRPGAHGRREAAYSPATS